jgi:hypothetical protein
MIVIVNHVMIVQKQAERDGLVEGLQKRSRHSWMKPEAFHPEMVLIFAFVSASTRHLPWID